MAEYNLQAEGTNGVTTTTGIDATPDWDASKTTEFPGGVILHVDGRNGQNPSNPISPINAIFGIGNAGGAGVFGLGAGPSPELPGTGVIGVAGSVTNPDASVGTNCGVLGISNDTGVYGRGDTWGVIGESDSVGVLGESERGRGGMFSTGVNQPVAQVQLVPVSVLATGGQGPSLKVDPLPQLPQGQAGDVLAVIVGFQEQPVVRLWFCVKSATGVAADRQPAIWAEIAFSRTVEGTGP